MVNLLLSNDWKVVLIFFLLVLVTPKVYPPHQHKQIKFGIQNTTPHQNMVDLMDDQSDFLSNQCLQNQLKQQFSIKQILKQQVYPLKQLSDSKWKLLKSGKFCLPLRNSVNLQLPALPHFEFERMKIEDSDNGVSTTGVQNNEVTSNMSEKKIDFNKQLQPDNLENDETVVDDEEFGIHSESSCKFEIREMCHCGVYVKNLTTDSYIGTTAFCEDCIKFEMPQIELATTLKAVKEAFGLEPFSIHLDCIDIGAAHHNLGKRRRMALDIGFKSLNNKSIEIPILDLVVEGTQSKPVGLMITEIVNFVVESSLAMGINVVFGVCDLAHEHMRFMLTIKTGITWIADVLHALNIIRNHLADGEALYLNGHDFKLKPNSLKVLRKKLSVSGNVLETIKELKVFFNAEGEIYKMVMDLDSDNYKLQSDFMKCCFFLLNLSISEKILTETDLISLNCK